MVIIPTLHKPEFNWDARCLEQGYIKWLKIVKNNFILHEYKEAYKASHVSGWIGDKES